ncbi:hypothetical protein JZO70_00005, partial [Enterococcus sp. 669A]
EAFRSTLGNQEMADFINSNNFSALRPAYGINILDFHLFEKDGPAIRKFGILDLDTFKLMRSHNGEEIIILCFMSLKNKNIDRNSAAYLWQQFFKTGEVPDDAPDYLKEAQKKTDFYSLAEEEQKLIMDMNKAKMVNDAVISTVDRKAREEGKIEVALNMLEENEPIDKILKYTGLTVEQIEEIQDRLL